MVGIRNLTTKSSQLPVRDYCHPSLLPDGFNFFSLCYSRDSVEVGTSFKFLFRTLFNSVCIINLCINARFLLEISHSILVQNILRDPHHYQFFIEYVVRDKRKFLINNKFTSNYDKHSRGTSGRYSFQTKPTTTLI